MNAFEGTIKEGVIIIPSIVLAELMFISKKGRITLNFKETLQRIEEYDNYQISALDVEISRRQGNCGKQECRSQVTNDHPDCNNQGGFFHIKVQVYRGEKPDFMALYRSLAGGVDTMGIKSGPMLGQGRSPKKEGFDFR